jgi:hypothetical protein
MEKIDLGSSLTFSALGGRGKEKILIKPAEKIELSREAISSENEKFVKWRDILKLARTYFEQNS